MNRENDIIGAPDAHEEKDVNQGRRDAVKLLGLGALSLLGNDRAAAAPEGVDAASRTSPPTRPGVFRTYHVSAASATSGVGTAASPFKTISEAAAVARAGDTITVHAGTYRERVNPLHGGSSDRERITYRAAPNEVVVITGSEPVTGWVRISNDTWKVSIPSKKFGNFNPYVDLIRGDWYSPASAGYHTGCVYLNDVALQEATQVSQVTRAAGARPLWYAQVDGNTGSYLSNLAWLKPAGGAQVSATNPSWRYGGITAAGSDGVACAAHIMADNLLRFDQVDFGAGSTSMDLRVSTNGNAAQIEIRLDTLDGPLLGVCDVQTSGWADWKTYSARIIPVSGKKNVCLVFKNPAIALGNTTIYAQFPGVDPNREQVEINVRQTVFYPEKTGVNYITVTGLTLKNAACNWAPPSAEQRAVIGVNWSKGWVIENNIVYHGRCAGISLGKYGDGYDNTNAAGAADPYTQTVLRALSNGWNKSTVGSHLVRKNVIHHCGQAGVVGSLGCSFSRAELNEIHDVNHDNQFDGAEMAGIKFHGAIDVVIDKNHIHRCGQVAGIWLDWMGQGARVTCNLLHDNAGVDLLLEMQHGPVLIDNNILLSAPAFIDSSGLAFAHNLMKGPMTVYNYDARVTPYHLPHSTTIAGYHDSPSGDYRFYNNLVTAPCSLALINSTRMSNAVAGNVFTKGATASSQDANSVVDSTYDPGVSLTEKGDGWYLKISEDAAWRRRATRNVVTTRLLGKAVIPGVDFENPDGTPLSMATDYFGATRSPSSPFPGPFETPASATEIKVWPRT